MSWATDKVRLFVAFGLVFAGALAQPLVALSTRNLTDVALEREEPVLVALWAAVLASGLVGQLLLAHFAHLWYFELGERLEVQLNLRIASGIHSVKTAVDIERPEIANDLDMARSDVARIRSTVASTINLCASVVQLLLTCALLSSVSFTLVILPIFALIPILATNFVDRPLEVARRNLAGAARLARHARECLSLPEHAVEAWLGNGESRLRHQHQQAYQKLAAEISAGYRRYALRRMVAQAPLILAMASGFIVIILLSLNQRTTPGETLMVLTIIMQVGGQASSAVLHLNAVATASSGLSRVKRLPGNVTRQMDAGHPVSSVTLGISVRELTFRYPAAGQPALDHVTFQVPPGSSVALVGENGSGKSTLVKLLQNLYQPETGLITLDNIPLDQVYRYHERSTALFQDFAQFPFQLGTSVGLGQVEHMSDEQVIVAASKRARTEALVVDAGGWDAELDVALGGRGLSGGQWQSVAFTRALMHTQPLVVTLDEPGHSLDPEAELRMLEAYTAAAREYAVQSGAIVFYVTHRLSSVRTADLVLVLRNGHVEAYGRHSELVQTSHYYGDLFRRQAAGYLAAGSAAKNEPGEG